MTVLARKDSSSECDLLWKLHADYQAEVKELDRNIMSLDEEEIIRMEQIQQELLWITDYCGILHYTNNFSELIATRLEEVRSTTCDFYRIRLLRDILSKLAAVPK